MLLPSFTQHQCAPRAFTLFILMFLQSLASRSRASSLWGGESNASGVGKNRRASMIDMFGQRVRGAVGVSVGRLIGWLGWLGSWLVGHCLLRASRRAAGPGVWVPPLPSHTSCGPATHDP